MSGRSLASKALIEGLLDGHQPLDALRELDACWENVNGDPDFIDSVVPTAYGNLALDLILGGIDGRMVVLKNGRYDHVPIEVVTETKKFVNVEKYYNKEKLHPYYKNFEMLPLFIMTAD